MRAGVCHGTECKLLQRTAAAAYNIGSIVFLGLRNMKLTPPTAKVSRLLVSVRALAGGSAFAQPPQPAAPLPFVSPIFGGNMVLQREKPNAIWGWSQPGDSVKVEIGENSATATAAEDGKWQARIQPPPAGGPYTIEIAGRQQTVELHEVLVGDVWICAGQSNMQFGLQQARNGAEEIKNALRLFSGGTSSGFGRGGPGSPIPAGTPAPAPPAFDIKTIYSGGMADPAEFNKKVKVFFFSTGTETPLENPEGLKKHQEQLIAAGITNSYFSRDLARMANLEKEPVHFCSPAVPGRPRGGLSEAAAEMK